MHKDRFFGVGEPLIQRQNDQGIDAVQALDLVKGLGCSAYRSWMDLVDVLRSPTVPNPDTVRDYTRLLDRAKELDIEVTSMSGTWFLPEGCRQKKGYG